MIKKVLLLLCILAFNSYHAEAQFFVPGDAPCASGSKVELDTIFYTPTTSMPFDRCFYLRMILKGNVQVSRFSLTPIDRNGKPKIRRRDYKVFIKSGWKKSQRKQIKKDIPYNNRQELVRLFKSVKTSYKDNQTEVILNVPPLDPNREYRLTLIQNDVTSLDKLIDIGELIFKSLDVRSTQAERDKYLVEANIAHDQLNETRIGKNKPVPEDFKDFETFLTTYTLRFSKTLKKSQAVNAYILAHIGSEKLPVKKQYKIIFSKNDISAQQAHDLSIEESFWSFSSKSNPEAFAISFSGKKDYDGNELSTSPTKYKIFVLVSDTLKSENNYTRQVDVTSGEIDFYKLGDIEVGNISEYFKIDVNRAIPGSDYVSFKPLVSFYDQMIQNKTNLSAPDITKFSCISVGEFKKLTDYILLCPCSDDGIKDFTQRDTLLQAVGTLSLISDDDKRNLLKGTVSIGNMHTITKENDMQARFSNYQNTISLLDFLNDFLLKVYVRTNVIDFKDILDCIRNFRSEIAKNYTQLKDIAIAKDIIKKEINKRFETSLLKSEKLSVTSTQTVDFMNNAKLRIVPDFGFIALLESDDGLRINDLTPYLGFSINFRPIDKSIPMRLVRYKPWYYYLSFNSGITLRSLKIDSRRDDFFGSSSLITGLGLRLNNYFQLTGGSVWFKSYDKNPLTNRKPLAFSPYAGLSLDLEIQDLFGGIKSLFKL